MTPNGIRASEQPGEEEPLMGKVVLSSCEQGGRDNVWVLLDGLGTDQRRVRGIVMVCRSSQ